jgi:hypothetical protein
MSSQLCQDYNLLQDQHSVRGEQKVSLAKPFADIVVHPAQGRLKMNAISESMAVEKKGAMSPRAGAVPGSKTAAGETVYGVKSSPIQAKDYASKERDKWLNRLAHEFLTLNGLFPFKEVFPTENCPEWVHRVELEYIGAVHPDADLKGATIFTPARMGGFLGNQCAYAVWMVESLEAMVEHAMKQPEKIKDFVERKEECEQGQIILRRFIEWYKALQHMAGRALKSCVYQSYEDMSGFLMAYSRAFSKKPRLGAGMGDFGSTTFGVYHFMLWHWRTVDQLDSVRALHDLLRRSMGEHRVGDLKRIEKICQRISLHYRKPGRPKASK